MKHNISHISLIGFGNIGRAIQKLLEDKKVVIEAWDKEPDRCTTNKPLEGIVGASEVLFLGVPAFAFREALQNIKPCLPPGAAVLSLTKGLEAETGKSSAEVMAEVLGEDRPWGILGGPMLAKEIMDGKEAFATVGAPKKIVFEKAEELFAGTKLKLEYSDDAIGVSLAGILKNIYALALGAIHALDASHNLKGEAAKRALNEMGDIMETLGGRRESVMTSAALADFIATGFSPHSRNFTAGEEMVRTGRYVPPKGALSGPEGVYSLAPLTGRLGGEVEKFPLLRSIYGVFAGGKPPKTILETFSAKPRTFWHELTHFEHHKAEDMTRKPKGAEKGRNS